MVELDMTIVAQMINFALAMFIIIKFGYKPVRKMMDEREALISSQLDAAAKAKIEAERMRLDYEQSLKRANQDAQDVIARAKKTAETQTAELLERARAESVKLLDQTRATLAMEREETLREIKAEVADLSVQVAGKILGQSMDASMHQQLVDESIEQMGNLPC